MRPGIDEDQHEEDVDRPLLGEPETELIAADGDGVEQTA
jgi:hypothetical protein